MGLGVIEVLGEPELLCAFELDELDEYEAKPLGNPDTLDVIDQWLE
jgi:hypothetical protein